MATVRAAGRGGVRAAPGRRVLLSALGLVLGAVALAPQSAAQQAPTLRAAPGSGQVLTMRSGGHAGFARLTLPLPGGTNWRLGRGGNGYLLQLDGTFGFDISAVFQRIPRQRIADLRPADQPGQIEIVLACDCHADAFEDGTGLLVIDIRDGPAPATAGFETALDGAAPDPSPPPAAGPEPFDWTERLARAPVPRPEALPIAVPDPPSTALTDPAAIARDALLRQFARAAAQGMIVPRPDARADLAAAAPPTGPDPLRNLGIDAETALDRAQRPAGARMQTDGTGRPCLPDALFDLAAWADDGPAWVQIAQARAGLLGEFDRHDPARVTALVRLYLALGFGAEARATLAALAPDLPDADILTALAGLIDDGLAPDPPRFAGMTDCAGAVALWAVLAEPALPPPARLHRDAVLQAFSALPAGLRRHLGGSLAARFLAVGDIDAAQGVRAAIGRAPGAAGTELVLIDAELALTRGAPETAAALLATPGLEGAPPSAETLAARAAAGLAAGQVLAPAMIEDLAARAFELRGTALGQRLTALEARALAGSGRFDEAFARLDALAADGQAGDLAFDLLQGLVGVADDAGFVLHALARPDWRGPDAPRVLRLALADRLLGLGLAADALDALQSTGTAEERALIARAHLRLDDAQAALRAVAGDGAAAAATRAAALIALQEYRAAALAYAEADLPEEAARAAWLSGDPGLVASLGAPTPAAVAALEPAPGPAESAENDAGMLARTAAQIDESRALRSTLSDLLAAHPAP